MSERANDEWIADLRASGEQKTRALDDLREMTVRALACIFGDTFATNNPAPILSAEAIAQKTQTRILEHLNTFDGQSAFTVWALKFAVRQALLELRQQRWQACASSPALAEIPPAAYAALAGDSFLLRFHQILKEELTDPQRAAIRAMVMLRVPKEQVMRQLGMERCDYFHMIHAARLSLKRRFQAEGWLPTVGDQHAD